METACATSCGESNQSQHHNGRLETPMASANKAIAPSLRDTSSRLCVDGSGIARLETRHMLGYSGLPDLRTMKTASWRLLLVNSSLHARILPFFNAIPAINAVPSWSRNCVFRVIALVEKRFEIVGCNPEAAAVAIAGLWLAAA